MAGRRAAAGFVALALLSCLGSCQAQGDESAAIIQTTLMNFRLSGTVASNFSQTMQTKFSDQLRARLQQFAFMSIAVSDFTVRPITVS